MVGTAITWRAVGEYAHTLVAKDPLDAFKKAIRFHFTCDYAPAFGDRDRGRIDHHDPEPEQQHREIVRVAPIHALQRQV